MWEISVAVALTALIVALTCYFVWVWHPANEPLENWRKQRDRKKLIRARLR